MWVSTGLSVSTQFPSLQDAPDLGWDFKFVGNITDLVTWVHIKRKYFFLHCPPPPKLSHHTGNIIGYGPLSACPAC